jgi:effector-binding domain-containing protein
VPDDVRSEWASPRVLAAISSATTPQGLGADIVRLLDVVWPVLREQGVRTDHNVVVYRGGAGGTLTVDVGVEVLSSFEDRGEVRRVLTPSGEVATAAHFGEYSDMGLAYAALERWCADHSRSPAGVNWEVYGDWEEDPAKRRTDVYFLLEPTGGPDG